MTCALTRGGEDSGKADKGTDKLREWDSDKEGGAGKKSVNFADIINGNPLKLLHVPGTICCKWALKGNGCIANKR